MPVINCTTIFWSVPGIMHTVTCMHSVYVARLCVHVHTKGTYVHTNLGSLVLEKLVQHVCESV